MNWSTKRSIDLSAPAVVAGVAGYFMYKKTKNWRVALISAAVGFVLAYIIASQITRNLYLQAEKPHDAPIVSDVSLNDCKNFDGTSILAAIHSDYDPGFFGSIFHVGDKNLYNQVLSLSNCELGMLYNQWNARYYADTKKSLRAAFAWMSQNGVLRGIANGDLLNAIDQRFQSLNLA